MCSLGVENANEDDGKLLTFGGSEVKRFWATIHANRQISYKIWTVSDLFIRDSSADLVVLDSQLFDCVHFANFWSIAAWKGWFGLTFSSSLRDTSATFGHEWQKMSARNVLFCFHFVFGSAACIRCPYLTCVLANLLFDLVNMFACVIKQSSCSKFA